ncbi:MAG: hypothetical protein IKO06_06535 [Alphaproteobacteria bacterium]|nr:hypothetical protein [Alphaproteobacteria bacterium]
MRKTYLGRIFVYDTDKKRLGEVKEFFEKRSFELFGTDNIYQLLNYARELNPDVIIFRVEENYNPVRASLSRLIPDISGRNYPIILIKPKQFEFVYHQGVAHYLHSPFDMDDLLDIVESYCVGQKDHHILLLDRYSENKNDFAQEIKKSEYQCFEVHNEDAAQLYLSKNNPQAVCIECAKGFVKAPTQINLSKIFYVDSRDDIAEIKKFLR